MATTQGPITLYSGQHQQMVRLLVSAFEKQTGIEVKVRDGSGPELANQIIREGKRTPADVFFTENSPQLVHLEHKGLLAPVAEQTLAAVPAQYSSASGYWVGVLARENVLTYNPQLANKADLPTSIVGLAKPNWPGEVGIHITSSDVLPLIKAIAIPDGRDTALHWLQGIKRNAKLYQHNSGTVNAVNHGDVAIGISNSYYYYRLREQVGQHNMLSRVYHFSAGDAGGLINISGAGVLKYADHPAAAQKLLAFMDSANAQSMLAHSTIDLEYPLRAGITANPQLKPLDALQPPQLTVDQIGDDREALELLHQAGLM